VVVGRLIAFACVVFLAAGCSHSVSLQADDGGFLTDEEIRPLDAVAQSTVATEPNPPKGPALPEYVFAFRPDFDVRKVTSLSILPFAALTKDGQDIARDIRPALVARAAANKVIPAASTSSSEVAPDAYVLSGAVTRTIGNDGATVMLNYLHEASVAMRLSRNNDVLGVIQVNSVGRQPTPFLALPSLIFSAFQGSRATLVSRRIEDVFAQLRSGHRTGASSSPSKSPSCRFRRRHQTRHNASKPSLDPVRFQEAPDGLLEIEGGVNIGLFEIRCSRVCVPVSVLT